MKRRGRIRKIKEPPRDRVRLVKIAPGENAYFWDDCRMGGYICVGWDEVGDLGKFKSKDDFKAAFKRRCRYSPPWKANELWTLIELRPCDRIIANHGLTKVVGVGTVEEPGYAWKPKRSPEGYCHTVKVRWDRTRWGKSDFIKVPRQPWNNTVKPVSRQLFERVSGRVIPPESITTGEAQREKRNRLLRSVRQRQGQPRFRAELLQAYGGRCAISDNDVPEALEAAHIDPDRRAVPANGILLRADLHSLFDSQLIGIEPATMRVHVRPTLKGSEYWTFNKRKVRLPEGSHLRPDARLLKERYHRIFRSA